MNGRAKGLLELEILYWVPEEVLRPETIQSRVVMELVGEVEKRV